MDQAKVVAAITDSAYLRKVIDRQADIGRLLGYLLATGNLKSSSGLDMMQVSGYTIVAEKLNYYRYLSHFRSVHRLAAVLCFPPFTQLIGRVSG